MSLRNIITGLLVAICLLAGGIAASFRFSMHPASILFIGIILAPFILGAGMARQRQTFLQRFRARACTGIRWRRRFPASTAPQIREFLDLILDAFGLPEKPRLSFSPDDNIFEIYCGLHPNPDLTPDCLEVETLALSLSKQYGLHDEVFLSEDITLGELFALCQAGKSSD